MVKIKLHQYDRETVLFGQLNEENELHGVGIKITPWSLYEG